MRIRIWNAFASNNSGSYTIVGTFSSATLAADVALELTKLVEAQDLWLEEYGGFKSARGRSPLSKFAEEHGLSARDNAGTGDDWPMGGIGPQAFSVSHQVFLHHDYTLTLPSLFGQYFYSMGGRVTHEIDHAHHPIVGIFELSVPWQEKEKDEKVAAVIKDLTALDGPLAKADKNYPPAWQTMDKFGNPDLTVGAIFEDLVTGFTAIDRVAASHGMHTVVKIFESYGDIDPLSFLRS